MHSVGDVFLTHDGKYAVKTGDATIKTFDDVTDRDAYVTKLRKKIAKKQQSNSTTSVQTT